MTTYNVKRHRGLEHSFEVVNPIPVTAPGLDIALGNVSGYSKINKFGEATDCDLNTDTDVWDGANGTTSTDIWVAPTQARVHEIASTSGDEAPAGTGMRTCRVYGLTDWDTAEVSEDIAMIDSAARDTVNSYVIIHRIVGLTFGSGGTNTGIVTATAKTDGTVTAAILASEGQTLMCIYGVPSTQTIHITRIAMNLLRNVAAASGDGTLLVKENADQSDSGFVTKDRFIVMSASPVNTSYSIPKSFNGPCVVKLQVNSSANNASVTGGFDAYIVDN